MARTLRSCEKYVKICVFGGIFCVCLNQVTISQYDSANELSNTLAYNVYKQVPVGNDYVCFDLLTYY